MTGNWPHTPAPLEAHCQEIFETAATLVATLGQPIFEPLTNAPTAMGKPELFYCKGSGADGRGEYTSEGFVVLKGSRARVEPVPSSKGTSGQRQRNLLITEGVLATSDGMLVFTRDHLFPSPSSAADVLTGRNANGWLEWKAANGRTLDELKRQAVQAAG